MKKWDWKETVSALEKKLGKLSCPLCKQDRWGVLDMPLCLFNGTGFSIFPPALGITVAVMTCQNCKYVVLININSEEREFNYDKTNSE